MRRSLRTTRWVAVAVAAGCAALAAVLTASSPAAVDRAAAPAAHNCLVMTGSGDPAFIKNFNPYTATGQPSGSFVQGAFYEPLIVTGEGGLKPVPWLARSWKWSNGNKTLTLNIARGVKWSDGKRLTAADVVYSFLAGRQDKLIDRVGLVGAGNSIVSVKARGTYNVAVTINTPDSQFIAATVNRQFVVPKHIWSKVGDVANFTNAKPVGSGPFNRITRFTSQDYVFAKNPKYYHAFYATTAYPISLVLDTTKYPYSLTAFRKALSLAIDRKTVSKLGEYGYAPPVDAIGLGGLFPKWVRDPAVKKQAKQMATYSPSAAKKALTDAGFKYRGSKLIDPKGDGVKLDIHVISGWSDWVASNQIITPNLRDIGIDSDVALEPDWGAWWPNASSGKFPTLLWQGGSQGSPYGYFYANLSRNAYIPSGQDATATGNWEHFADDKATSLLNQWKVTLNPAKQQRIATQLEKVWLDHLPIVPLFIGPRWSTYSTKYFHCFSTKKNFYGDPIFTTFPDNILSFTRICPGAKSGA